MRVASARQCATSRDTPISPQLSSRAVARSSAPVAWIRRIPGWEGLGGRDHRRAYTDREVAGDGHDRKRGGADDSDARECDERPNTYHQRETRDCGQGVREQQLAV